MRCDGEPKRSRAAFPAPDRIPRPIAILYSCCRVFVRTCRRGNVQTSSHRISGLQAQNLLVECNAVPASVHSSERHELNAGTLSMERLDSKFELKSLAEKANGRDKRGSASRPFIFVVTVLTPATT